MAKTSIMSQNVTAFTKMHFFDMQNAMMMLVGPTDEKYFISFDKQQL